MNALDDLPSDFRDLLIAFVDEGVELVLVGGWAMAIHGRVRATEDLDVFVRPTRENAARVFRALASFGAPVAQHSIDELTFADERYGYRFGLKPLCIEVLTSISGVEFQDTLDGAPHITLDGRDVPVIGRAALLRNKRAAGRLKDLDDVAWLERHSPP